MSDKIARSDRDISLHNNVRLHDCPITDHRLRPDHREWADLDIGADSRALIDNRRRMNFHRTPASLKLK
jgi:hypothetical protein